MKKKAKRNGPLIPRFRRRQKDPRTLMMGEGYLSTLQAAQLIGVSTLSVQRWFDEGMLVGARLPGGKRMIESKSMRRFFDKHGLKPADLPSRDKPIVLLVDDDAKLLEQMRSYLDESGRWTVRAARTGLEAGLILGELRPECLVLDVMLEDVPGHELVRRIRAAEAGRTVRIVAISGRADAGDVKKITEAGANSFLAKPFQMKDLEQALSAGFGLVARAA